MHSDTPSTATLDCLRQLIGFDTTSRNSNLALIDWAGALLEGHGAKLRRAYNADRTKANLFATFGEGPGGIVLSGHTDVVPTNGQPWTSDPFKAEVRNGRLYGRGACDMKGFIGVVLGHAAQFAAAPLRTPIHIALSYDEEVGCLGIPVLLDELAIAGIKPDGCVVGEPTDMQVVTAHKGGRVYRCKVHGRAAHSSLTPQGLNAIEYAARVITFIQDLAWREEEQGPRVDGFGVPYTTISTNVISGGNGRNIIPAECEFFFDYRYVPGVEADRFINTIQAYVAEHVEPRMKARFPDAGVTLERMSDVPALDAKEQDSITLLAKSLLRPHASAKVSYGTEGGFFQRSGTPTIICGPGSIEQAHKADEYVDLSQLQQCEQFMDKLVQRLSDTSKST
jgi:acetylornithine deacetylase